MEKIYIAPDFEVLDCELINDVVLASTEPTIPIQYNTEPLPTGGEIEDF